MKTRSRMRRPPSYWWDFKHLPDGAMKVAVETDDPRCESGVVREFDATELGISQAIKLIADLEAGRAALRAQQEERT